MCDECDCRCDETAVDRHWREADERQHRIKRLNSRPQQRAEFKEHTLWLHRHHWITAWGIPSWEATALSKIAEVVMEAYLPVVREQLNAPTLWNVDLGRGLPRLEHSDAPPG